MTFLKGRDLRCCQILGGAWNPPRFSNYADDLLERSGTGAKSLLIIFQKHPSLRAVLGILSTSCTFRFLCAGLAQIRALLKDSKKASRVYLQSLQEIVMWGQTVFSVFLSSRGK